ncbi:MAG: ABC transporter permease, partial [Prevotellaceae bacterium]|jgi:ABC-2 type transport system permease protein|nr:ABC transporter permease [Prevotellaceae bacterium]
MKNTLALTKRILQQFSHDKRTIALFMIAPIVVLWLFSVILGTPSYEPKIVAVDLPNEFVEALNNQKATTTCHSREGGNLLIVETLLENQEIDAILTLQNDTLFIKVEGADASRTAAVMSVVQSAFREVLNAQKAAMEKNKSKIAMAKMMGFDVPKMSINFSEIKLNFLHGDENWTTFDFFGPVFIGIFIFIFVFITSGMSLVTERTGGTMERLLVSPIKSWQLVAGYSLGFGIVSLVQACIVLLASTYLIGFPCVGSFWLVVLIAFSMALVSLTLGLLVSALAKTAFQVIQFMIILVVPQVLLSGIFDLSQSPLWLQITGQCFPIYHGADALRDVMLRGAGFADILPDFAILWGFILVFFVISTISFNVRRRS